MLLARVLFAQLYKSQPLTELRAIERRLGLKHGADFEHWATKESQKPNETAAGRDTRVKKNREAWQAASRAASEEKRRHDCCDGKRRPGPMTLY